MRGPIWIDEARRWQGLREIPGPVHAEPVRRWLREMSAWWDDDETPWCGVFADHCMRFAGSTPPAASYRARSWLNWGIELEKPLFGCVAIFPRAKGAHVCFVVGQYPPVGLSCLGGNQDNEVNVSVFTREPLGYRWPREFTHLMADYDKVLPLVPAMKTRSEA